MNRIKLTDIPLIGSLLDELFTNDPRRKEFSGPSTSESRLARALREIELAEGQRITKERPHG